jgi:hypothetical protein
MNKKTDIITQGELENALGLVMGSWKAMVDAAHAADKIIARVNSGATVEPGRLEVNTDLGLVSTPSFIDFVKTQYPPAPPLPRPEDGSG